MTCSEPGCSKPVDRDGVCFLHRVKGVGFSLRGPVLTGSSNWNRSRTDHMIENFGTADDRELGKRGIERA